MPTAFLRGGCLDGVCEHLLLVVPMAPSQECDAPDKDTELPGNQQSIPSPDSCGEHRRIMVSLFSGCPILGPRGFWLINNWGSVAQC